MCRCREDSRSWEFQYKCKTGQEPPTRAVVFILRLTLQGKHMDAQVPPHATDCSSQEMIWLTYSAYCFLRTALSQQALVFDWLWFKCCLIQLTKPLLHHLFKAETAQLYCASPLCIKVKKVEWGVIFFSTSRGSRFIIPLYVGQGWSVTI